MRKRTILSTLLAISLVLGGAAFAVWRVLDRGLSLSAPGSPACVADGGSGTVPASGSEETTLSTESTATSPSASLTEVTLVPKRMANAATITAVGINMEVPRRAIVVALATALQESKLDNLTGGDRDSLGLFQQRPSQGWGTEEEISNPRYAARAFYSALLNVTGWQEMRVTDAAQAVQRSAYAELYEQWAPTAEILTTALAGEASQAVTCTLTGELDMAGSSAAASLVAQLRLDWGDEIEAATTTNSLGVEVSVDNARTGWQYAHWLVANAQGFGVTQVRFADGEWTVGAGAWRDADGSDQAGDTLVTVEVTS